MLIFYSVIKPDLGSLSPSDSRCAPSWACCRRPLWRIWHAKLCSCCQGTSHVSQRETSVGFLSRLLHALKEHLLPSAGLPVFSGCSTVNYTCEMPSIFRPFCLVALTAKCHLQSQLLSCAYWKNVILYYSSSIWPHRYSFAKDRKLTNALGLPLLLFAFINASMIKSLLSCCHSDISCWF